MARLNEPAFISDINDIESKHGGMICRVKLVGVKTRQELTCYVDPGNRNFRRWETTIKAARTKGVVLNNLRWKDESKNLIDADSRISVEVVTSKQDLAEQMAEFWKQQSHWNRLFGDDDAD